MPGPPVTPFHGDQRPPDRADIVIIGGGIIGVSAALELAERGYSVVLCEKGQIGGEQSSRNWGWVRMSQRDPREVPLMAEALRIWDGLDARVGRSTGFVRCGIVYAAKNHKSLARYERWADHAVPYQIKSRVLTGQELSAQFPGWRSPVAGGFLTPDDGRAEPQRAAPAIAEGARAKGAVIMTGCAVRSLDMEAGRVSGVVTEKGRIKCGAALLAGGVWSRLFAGNAGLQLPQLKVMNTVMRTTPVDGPDTSLWTSGFAMRKRADGGYTVASGDYNTVDIVPDSFRLAMTFLPVFAQDWRVLRFRLGPRWAEEAAQPRSWRPDQITPFEACRVLDPAPSQRILRDSWAQAQRAFPMFQKADVVQSWAGLIDVTPDAIPVISGVDALPGFYIATGFSGHGFGIGPAAGRLAADLVTGGDPIVDPAPFRFSRFTERGGIKPGRAA